MQSDAASVMTFRRIKYYGAARQFAGCTNHSLRIPQSCIIFDDRFCEKKLCSLVDHVLITALRPSELGTGRQMTQRTEPP